MLPAKRDYTKFFTPIEIADKMVKLLNPKPGEAILEPHAGDGAIVKRIKAYCPESIVFAIELYPEWEKSLMQFAEVVVINDFLQIPEIAKWTKCIANPPFGNGIDLYAHFDKIRRCVKSGGKVVVLVPKDFEAGVEFLEYKIDNWATNRDGTKTEIKIIEFYN
jgi:16S rRNA A1518/A1519 N6-dimethyltransferase RsmA/KsgA/DIM1 with predicted DNA glycosylase/AP lyase activity